MLDHYSCGMSPAEVAAEASEAQRETDAFETQRKAELEIKLAKLTKDARFYQTHKAQRMYEAAMDRARNKNAVPDWLTKDDEAAILKKYQLAVDLETVTGVPHSVDHIIALKGICRKTWLASGRRFRKHVVCGLHVPDNLDVIPLGINREIKRDWFDSDWPAWPIDEEEAELYGFGADDGDDEIPF